MLTFLKELLSGNRRKGKRLEAIENEKNEPTLAELDEELWGLVDSLYEEPELTIGGDAGSLFGDVDARPVEAGAPSFPEFYPQGVAAALGREGLEGRSVSGEFIAALASGGMNWENPQRDLDAALSYFEESRTWGNAAMKTLVAQTARIIGLRLNCREYARRDPVEAAKWLSKAAEFGDERAAEALKNLRKARQGKGNARNATIILTAALVATALCATIDCKKGKPSPERDAIVKQADKAESNVDDDAKAKEAFEAALAAAEAGDADAAFKVGGYYYQGMGVEQNYEEALEWFRKSSELGSSRATYNVGVFYEQGVGVEQNYEEALVWYRKAAEMGDVDAAFNIGVYYYQGMGVEQNYEEALVWYRKAAEMGNADAAFNIAVCYSRGLGAEQSYEDALEWFRKSSELGFPIATYNVGVYYAEGQGGEQDYEEAAKWLRQSAEEGYTVAAFNLGTYYLQGTGVPQDAQEGAKWIRKSAEGGFALAAAQLGVCYLKGDGVPQDEREAVRFTRQGAEGGIARAAETLALFYETGVGGERDLDEARKWQEKAEELRALESDPSNQPQLVEMRRWLQEVWKNK